MIALLLLSSPLLSSEADLDIPDLHAGTFKIAGKTAPPRLRHRHMRMEDEFSAGDVTANLDAGHTCVIVVRPKSKR